MNKNITYRRIWEIAWPIILGSVAQNILNFTDTAFLGRVGEVALGAGALGGLLYLAMVMLALGFGTGAQVIIARRLGEGRKKETGGITDHSMAFLLVLALFVFLFLRFGSVLFLKYTVHSPEIYHATLEYLQYRSFGIFFAFANITFRSFYVGIGRTRAITYTTFLLAIVNIVLDYLLIFGKMGFPAMGIAGAALASVIAEGVALIYFLGYTLFVMKPKEYGLFSYAQLHYSKLRAILKVATPTMLQQFISLFTWFLFFLFVEKIGKAELAVSNIIRSLYVFLMMPVWGFAAASNTLVSFTIGQGHPQKAMRLVIKIIVLCVSAVLIMVALGLAAPRMLFEIFTNNEQLIALGIPILRLVSITALIISVGFMLFNAVTGTGKTKVSLAIEMVVLFIYLLYVFLIVIVLRQGVWMAWTSELLYGTFLSLFSLLYLKFGKWKTYKI